MIIKFENFPKFARFGLFCMYVFLEKVSNIALWARFGIYFSFPSITAANVTGIKIFAMTIE